MRALLIAASAAALSGCIVIDADVDSDFDFDDGRSMERLYAASVDADGVRVRAASNGCTDVEDFDAKVRRRGDDRFAVRFYREDADYCRALLPDGVELFFAYEDLGLPPGVSVTIDNPIGRTNDNRTARSTE